MRWALIAVLTVVMTGVVGCGDSGGGGGGDADSDMDSDSDMDTDVDTDTDTDTGTGTDTGSDTGTGTDTGSDTGTGTGPVEDCDDDAENTTVGDAITIEDGDAFDGILCGTGAMDYFAFRLSDPSFNATVTFSSAAGDLDLHYTLPDGTTNLFTSSDGVDEEVIELNPGNFAVGMDYVLRVDLIDGDALLYTISLDMF